MPEQQSTDLHHALEQEDLDKARGLLAGEHASEIARILESLPGKQRSVVWTLVKPELRGDVLTHLEEDIRSGLLAEMQPDTVAQITQGLEFDDAADILQHLPEDALSSALDSMNQSNRERLASILSYSKDTAGGLMNTDVVPVRADINLDVVMRYLRALGEMPEKTDNLMVVDRDNHYLGVLPLAKVLVSEPQSLVRDLMEEEQAVQSDLPETEVAQLFEQLDLVSVAVVNKQTQLLGRVTVDDVVDVIQQQADQQMRNMAGLGERDVFAPVLFSTRRRATWLGINLLTAIVAAWVISLFQQSIQSLVVLAVLMPIVAGMGGIAGIQTLTISIRGIALGRLGKENLRALLLKELAVSFLNGALWAIAMALIVILWFGDGMLAMITAAAIIINLFFAGFAGTMIPFVLEHFNIDPAVAGGVILTTITDVLGFFSFLGLATIILLN